MPGGGMKIGEMFFDIMGRTGALFADFDKVKSGAAKLGGQLNSIGGTLTRGLTLPLMAAGGLALKFATDLNTAMANVGSLIPGATDRVIELKQSVQDMAIMTGQATGDLANGLYQLISAFGDTADTAAILEINAKAAAGGVASVTDAINLTSAVTKAYNDTSAAAIEHAADLALMTVRLGQTTFPELAASIGRVTSQSNYLGVSQEELFGVFATLTGVTGSAAEVSTQFAGVLKALMNPTAAMTALLAELGFASGAAMMEGLGLQGSIQAITDAAERAGVPLQQFIGSEEGVIAALALAGPQADAFTEKLGAMGDAAGTTEQTFDDLMKGVNATGFTLAQLKQVGVVAMQELGDAIGAALDPETVKDLKDSVEGLIDAFGKLAPETQAAIVKFGGLLIVLGPVAGALGAVVTIGGKVVPALKWVSAAAATVGAAIGTVASIVAGGVVAIIASLAWMYSEAQNQGMSMWGLWVNGWQNAGRAIVSAVRGTASAVVGALSGMAFAGIAAVSRLGSGIVSILSSGMNRAVSAVRAAVSRVVGAFSGLYGKLVGRSIVPDMIDEVQAWFEKLGSSAMVRPAQFATEAAAEAFASMADRVKSTIAGLGRDLRVSQTWAALMGDEWGAMADEARMLEGAIKNLLAEGLSPQDAATRDLIDQYRVLTTSGEGHIAALEHEIEVRKRAVEQAEIHARVARWEAELSVHDAEARADQRERRRESLAETAATLARLTALAADAWRAGVQKWIDAGIAAREIMQNAVDSIIGKDLYTRPERWVQAGPPPLVANLLNAEGELQTIEERIVSIGRTAKSAGERFAGWLNDFIGIGRTVQSVARTLEDLGVKTSSTFGRLLDDTLKWAQLVGQVSSLLDGFGGLGGLGAIASWLFGGGSIFGGLFKGLFKGLASGGTLRTPGTVLVGERGPELLNLPRGAQVTPLAEAGAARHMTVIMELDGREIARKTLPYQVGEYRLRGVTT